MSSASYQLDEWSSASDASLSCVTGGGGIGDGIAGSAYSCFSMMLGSDGVVGGATRGSGGAAGAASFGESGAAGTPGTSAEGAGAGVAGVAEAGGAGAAVGGATCARARVDSSATNAVDEREGTTLCMIIGNLG